MDPFKNIYDVCHMLRPIDCVELLMNPYVARFPDDYADGYLR
jgi:hypothetical protein